ncbi:hypothetical protein EB796_024999 [Bugula neritina]|uniref:DH domain-containing protein n=1 Tax=Bugula neritina TaxID=10212 RepID=A0A7J7IRX1_BUGNE|nr:hypothetical protein EB796_024999 [Bugula neritina]
MDKLAHMFVAAEEEKKDLDKDEGVNDPSATESYMLNDSPSDTFITSGKTALYHSPTASSKELMSMRRRRGAFTSSLSTMPQVEYADHPDRRFVIAKEILSTEISYNQELDILKRVFVLPLKEY